MKLTHVVVSKAKKAMIGFVGEENGNQMGLTVQSMLSDGFSNDQLEFTQRGGIIEKRGFKISSLGMMYSVDNQIYEVPNGIKVVGQVQRKGKLLGYMVEFGDGEKTALDIKTLARISGWFKGVNFSAIKGDDGPYLRGLNGTKIAELPVIEYPEKRDQVPENVKKTFESQKIPPVQKAQANAVPSKKKEKAMEPKLGMFKLYRELAEMDGYLGVVPNSKYKSTTPKTADAGYGFIPLEYGEMASAKNGLVFNKEEFNISAKFVKCGNVKVGDAMVFCRVYRTKKIIDNGKIHMDKMLVCVPSDSVVRIENLVGDPVRLKKLEDKRMEKAVNMLTDRSNLVTYILDLEGFKLFEGNEIQDFMLNSESLYRLVNIREGFEIATKVLRAGTGLLKSVKDSVLRVGGAEEWARIEDKKVWHKYSGYNEEFLAEMRASGIETHTGIYTFTEKSSKKEDELESEAQGKSENKALDYELTGVNLKELTFKKVSGMLAAGEKVPGLSEEYQTTLAQIVKGYNRADGDGDLKKLEKVFKKIEEIQDKVVKPGLNRVNMSLACYKMALYLQGGGTSVHVADSQDWEQIKSRKKVYTVYENKIHSDLKANLKGLVIGAV
jgi:hypothetical protein